MLFFPRRRNPIVAEPENPQHSSFDPTYKNVHKYEFGTLKEVSFVAPKVEVKIEPPEILSVFEFRASSALAGSSQKMYRARREEMNLFFSNEKAPQLSCS